MWRGLFSLMRCILIEDDPISQRVIRGHIYKAGLEIVATATSVAEARRTSMGGGFDLALCDIELPDGSGLDLSRDLVDLAEVVLVTARERYAVDAFAIGAADYLLKPVSYERFVQAVERVRQLIAGRVSEQEVADGEALPDGPVFFRIGGDLVRVDLRSVVRIEAQRDYVYLRGPDLRLHMTMKALEERLPVSFARVHRSHIVRLDRVEGIQQGDAVVAGEAVPIGGKYREDLLTRLESL